MAKKGRATSFLLPALPDAEFTRAGKLAFWKRILPEGQSIDYRYKDGTKARIDFTEQSNAELVDAYRKGAMDQTPFMLADVENRHTMDPEQFRGEVADLRRHTELPPEVAATVADDDGTVAPGLWAKVEFATKKAAKAVLQNPKLGVSARIRQGDGSKPTRIIHVLGTLDPKVKGLGGWKPALDFSDYARDQVIDLTAEHYTEVPVGKKNKRGSGRSVDLADAPALADVSLDDIEEMTDDEIAAFLAKNAPSFSADLAESYDDDDDDFSEGAVRQIDLANARAEQASRDGREALKRAAAIEWKANRTSLLREGVPPHVLDLAEPVLARPYDLVVDLSETDDGSLDVADVVRRLVDGYKGTVDLSDVDLGHGGDEGGADPEADVKTRFAAAFPLEV